MATTQGGRYEPLTDERGFVGTKVGGRLVLTLPGEVPACRECGTKMNFLIQLRLPPDENGGYRAALVFMCENDPGMCDSWDPSSGANSVVLVRELTSIPPEGELPYPPYQVVWVEHPDFTRDPNVLSEAPDEARAEQEWKDFQAKFKLTKRHGYPIWIQNPEAPVCPVCGGPTVFEAQFDSVVGEHPLAPQGVMINFGDTGVGYLFLCEKRCSDRGGAFLWQCS